MPKFDLFNQIFLTIMKTTDFLETMSLKNKSHLVISILVKKHSLKSKLYFTKSQK